MYHELFRDASFWQFLFSIDQDLAKSIHEKGCPCGGCLHSAKYPRKPRGGPDNLSDHYGYRLSFCCNRDGCRKRATPPSVRFLGRKVYLAAVVILVAIAVMFSARLNVVLTLMCCTSVFLIGLIHDWIFGRHAEALWAKIAGVLIPNFQVFWISDAIYEGVAPPAAYLLMGVIYASLYTAGILFLAIALFQRRQVG